MCRLMVITSIMEKYSIFLVFGELNFKGIMITNSLDVIMYVHVVVNFPKQCRKVLDFQFILF